MRRFGMLCVVVAIWFTVGFSWGDELRLATEGTSKYRIVVPDNSNKVVAHAAEEFQDLLKQMSGVNRLMEKVRAYRV